MIKKILVTGANGFIGKNICYALKSSNYEVFKYDINDTTNQLENLVDKCDFIIHLAATNRSENINDFEKNNVVLTELLIKLIIASNKKIPVIFASSIQATNSTPFGESKRKAEDILKCFSSERKNCVYIYRLPNLFGKWGTPNYNSVVATYCYNIARNIDIRIDERIEPLRLVYIDDVINSFMAKIKNYSIIDSSFEYCTVTPEYQITLNELANTLLKFKKEREKLIISEINNNELTKKLYSTYISYIDENDLSTALSAHLDKRGSFTELLKSTSFGQISINKIRAKQVKGNHFHMSKVEKYIVVDGVCEIKLRKIGECNIASYICDGKNLKIVDIPPGYTHNITNVSNEDALVLIWVDEIFDGDHADTYIEEV